jgi:hypothetical protein
VRLVEEYISRHGLNFRGALHVRKGFVYSRGGSELLSIYWNEVGPHPGFYVISECVLDTACRVRRSHKVVWDEYEALLIDLVKSSGPIISDRNAVFNLTWEYFVRRHESLLAGFVPLSRLIRTLDPSNPSRLVECMELLENLGDASPAALSFWNSKAFSLIESYCYWAADL